jgi:hypothetical protein
MKFNKFISFFFHPINFSIIGAVVYFLFVPKFIYKPQEHLILTVVFIGSYVFPVLLLMLLKRFGMINSYHMESIEERKFPTLLFISISYIIGNWLFKSNVVDLLALIYFGYGLALIFSYILLYFQIKISLHTAAISGLIGFLIYFSYFYKINLIIILAVVFALSGIIGSSRLKLKAHNLNEVGLGYMIGLSSQFIVYMIYII